MSSKYNIAIIFDKFKLSEMALKKNMISKIYKTITKRITVEVCDGQGI